MFDSEQKRAALDAARTRTKNRQKDDDVVKFADEARSSKLGIKKAFRRNNQGNSLARGDVAKGVLEARADLDNKNN